MRYCQLWNILVGFFVLLTFSQCASPLPPSGGIKDEIPPKIDTLKSSRNFQTNFKKQRIELTFDEWIVLEDVFNQVIVSPPLNGKPEIKLKGKTVRFDFPEEDTLRANTTYTINFGEAVKDLTEKNPADQLRFVFSTGDFIDSLRMSGQIVDAFTGEPEEDVLFLLYENQADSVVRTERPFYFAKTKEEGRFQIENVKAGVYKGFALKDVNFNYLFDLDNEEIAFPDSLIEISAEKAPSVQVRLFAEEERLRLMDNDVQRYGQAVLQFNKRPSNYELTYDDLGQKVRINEMEDSVKVWYDLPQAEYWKIYVQQDTNWYDTVQVRPLERGDFFESAELKALNLNATTPKKVNPIKAVQLLFNHPIEIMDTSLVQLLEDSVKLRVVPSVLEVDSTLGQSIRLRHSWKEGIVYELVFLPGALTDFFGLQNDTIRQSYIVEERKRFGNLNLTLTDLDTTEAYVVQLMFRKDNLVEEFQINEVSRFQRNFVALPPGQYSIQIITDRNRNGKWDTGKYDAKRQPEEIIIRPLEQQLRANWDVEATISLTAPPPAPKPANSSRNRR